MSKTCAIVPAAGRGLRMGAAKPKQFLELCGKPILLHTLEALSRVRFLSEILLVVPGEFLPAAESLLSHSGLQVPRRRGRVPLSIPADPFPPEEHEFSKEGMPSDGREGDSPPSVLVVAGGAERQDSVFNGLRALPPDCEWVFVHDGVRPFASPGLLERTWEAARYTGAAIAALPASDTVKRVHAGLVLETLPRDEVWLVQTPQVFRRDILMEAYREAQRQGWSGTDDAFLVESLGVPVTVVPGERANIKVTTPEDLVWGSWILSQTPFQCGPATGLGNQ